MFLDIHIHLSTSCELPVQQDLPRVAGPVELIEMFDAVGIDRAVMLPLVTPENSLLVAKQRGDPGDRRGVPGPLHTLLQHRPPPPQELGGHRPLLRHQPLQGKGLQGHRGALGRERLQCGESRPGIRVWVLERVPGQALLRHGYLGDPSPARPADLAGGFPHRRPGHGQDRPGGLRQDSPQECRACAQAVAAEVDLKDNTNELQGGAK